MSTGKTVLAVLGVVVAVVALVAGAYLVKVALSGPVGQGDAIVKKNSAANWTAAQARFEGMYANVVATDKKITVAKTALDLDPEDKTLQENYTGVQNVCLSMVADYNKEARSYLAADFRAADLPDQISDFDPATDCKE